MNRARLVILFTLGAALAGCVTERRAVAPERPTDPAASRRFEGEPVAKAATNIRASSSRIIVGVQPIGSVPYDAQVLPIISTDGAYLATQTGDAPDWPTLLAENGPRLTLGTKIRIFDISARAPKEIRPRTPLPPSLLLGRSANDRGFLVESPQLDGSRRIGFVTWQTGELNWITEDDNVNAFAAFSTRGDLAWMSYRDFDPPILNIRTARGVRIEQPFPADIRRVYPVFTDDPTTIYIFELSEQGIDLAARELGATKLGPTTSRRRIATIADPFLVYQTLVAIQSPVPSQGADGRLAFLHPTTGRVTLFEPSTGALTPLTDRSIAAAPINDGAAPGMALTTPEGLLYQRLPTNADPRPATHLLEGDHVPRATSNPQFPLILISPNANSPGRVSLTRVNLPEHTP